MNLRSPIAISSLALCMALTAVTAFSQTTVLYETGFESSDVSGANFVLGGLDGQGGWIASGAVVTDEEAQTGAQSVYMPADSMIERDLAGAGRVFIIGHYRGEGSPVEDPEYPASPPAACIVHFSQANGIQCLDGDGAGDGVLVPAAGGTAVSADAWTQIVLHINYDGAKWDCLVDGSVYQTGLGFRDSISALSGFKSLSGSESYFDSFRVIASSGDADGDGISDDFEIANGYDPLDPGSTPLHLFDVNGDGRVTALDGLIQYRIATGQMTQTTEILRDVNGDGVADAYDGLLIYMWANGLIPVLPVVE